MNAISERRHIFQGWLYYVSLTPMYPLVFKPCTFSGDHMMLLLFTGHRGEVFEVAIEDLAYLSSSDPPTSLSGISGPRLSDAVSPGASETSSYPTITVSGICYTQERPVIDRRTSKLSTRRKHSVSDQCNSVSVVEFPKVNFVYNDYGDLVDVGKLKTLADLTVTETLRLILRAHHSKVCHQGFVLLPLQSKQYVN
jgi:hypothetical protein